MVRGNVPRRDLSLWINVARSCRRSYDPDHALAQLFAAVLFAAMDLDFLVRQLAEPSARQAAGDALVQAGEAAVEPLMAVIGDEHAEHDVLWFGTAVLHRIGEPAFEPLVDLIANTDSWPVVVHAGNALQGLQVSDRARYLPLLGHPSANVRNRAAGALQSWKADALPYASALLPLLTDPDDEVQVRAVSALKQMGPGVIPVLRGVRRTPGPHRREVLAALAEVGGWDALDAYDQAVVQRLIRVKLAHEVPAPTQVCGGWYALPTGDQAAVLDAFDLSDAMPVTMRLGTHAWLHDHLRFDAWPGSRTYVSPVLDGWTLVFENLPDDETSADSDGDRIQDSCAALSRRFGAAHWYCLCQAFTEWCIAERGEVIRYYSEEEQVGPHTPRRRAMPCVRRTAPWTDATPRTLRHAPRSTPPGSAGTPASKDTACSP